MNLRCGENMLSQSMEVWCICWGSIKGIFEDIWGYLKIKKTEGGSSATSLLHQALKALWFAVGVNQLWSKTETSARCCSINDVVLLNYGKPLPFIPFMYIHVQHCCNISRLEMFIFHHKVEMDVGWYYGYGMGCKYWSSKIHGWICGSICNPIFTHRRTWWWCNRIKRVLGRAIELLMKWTHVSFLRTTDYQKNK